MKSNINIIFIQFYEILSLKTVKQRERHSLNYSMNVMKTVDRIRYSSKGLALIVSSVVAVTYLNIGNHRD